MNFFTASEAIRGQDYFYSKKCRDIVNYFGNTIWGKSRFIGTNITNEELSGDKYLFCGVSPFFVQVRTGSPLPLLQGGLTQI